VGHCGSGSGDGGGVGVGVGGVWSVVETASNLVRFLARCSGTLTERGKKKP